MNPKIPPGAIQTKSRYGIRDKNSLFFFLSSLHLSACESTQTLEYQTFRILISGG